jgi:hypothetical protein
MPRRARIAVTGLRTASGVGPTQVVDTAVECFKNWRIISLKVLYLGLKRIL